MKNTLNRFGLKARFAVIFIFSTLLVLIISLTAWRNMSGQHKTVVDISENKLPAINFLLQLDRDLHQALIAVNNLTNINDPGKADKYYEDYTSNMKQVTERWAKLKELDTSAADMAMFKSFEDGFAKWNAAADGYISEFRNAAFTDTLTRITRGAELQAAFDNSREQINKLTENIEARIEEERKINEENYEKSIYVSSDNCTGLSVRHPDSLVLFLFKYS